MIGAILYSSSVVGRGRARWVSLDSNRRLRQREWSRQRGGRASAEAGASVAGLIGRGVSSFATVQGALAAGEQTMCHFCVKSGSNNISDTYDVHSKGVCSVISAAQGGGVAMGDVSADWPLAALAVLGQGRFAVVKAATCKKTGQQVAVKVIDKSRCKIEDQVLLGL